MEEVSIKTIDGVNLAGLLWDRKSKTSVLLLHAMPETKQSWEPLAEELYTKGINVLAIDFRGHGDSDGKDYKKQSDEDIQSYYMDARAALNFLEEKYQHTNFRVAGASIGANIALQMMAGDKTITKCIAMSAGLDYHGVKAKDFVKDLSDGQEVWFIAANDDDSNKQAAKHAETLEDLSAGSSKEVSIFEKGGHGTQILDKNPDLLEELVEYLG